MPNEDVCGIRKYYGRGGDYARFFLSGGILTVDIGEPLGYLCTIEIAVGSLDKIIKNKGFVYIMLKHDGNLYIIFPLKTEKRKKQSKRKRSKH